MYLKADALECLFQFSPTHLKQCGPFIFSILKIDTVK